MGEFKFRLPPQWTLERRQSAAIHTVGLDGIPWPCKISINDSVLSVSRNRNESGKTFIPYSFPNYGELLISTGTLPEREEPYSMLMELARGTLNRLRNQLSIWQEGGLKITTAINDGVTQATSLLSKAIAHNEDKQRDEFSRQSIEKTMDSIFELAKLFGTEVTKFRQGNSEAHPFWMANTVSDDQPIENGLKHSPFDLIRVSPKMLDQTNKQPLSKRAIDGPFLDASSSGMSEELEQMGDFQVRRNHILSTTREHMSQLSPAVSLIHVASGLNGMGHRHLSYPQQLEITTQLLQTVEESTQEIPTLVSFDFPWAERLASAVGGSHPLQIADSLLRQGSQISFLGIEVNLGYWPGGSIMRDPIQWIDMLDVWTQLGLPLVIILRAPTWSTGNDEVLLGDADENQPRHVNTFDRTNDQRRIDYLRTILPMLVARPAVHGLIWSQWLDSDDERYPNGGLENAAGEMKSIYEVLRSLPR
ncbi:hypothetical protein OAG71_00905 [bacterium]|nr:hypothetical protein [bacterium]